MKQLITICFLLGMMVSSLFGQTGLTKMEAPARTDYPIVKEIRPEMRRQLTCGEDRIFYPALKLSGTTINLWGMPANGFFSAAAQTYEVPAGATLTLNGFAFEGRYLPSGTSADITVNAQVYNVSAANVPVGAPLATTTVVIDTSNGTDLFIATFPTPLSVTQNFALVVENPTDTAFSMATNFASTTDGRGDFLAALRRPVASGGWTNGQAIGIGGGAVFDVDFLMYPFVVYDFDTDLIADRTCLTQETPVEFTAVASPILSSKFFNRNVFETVYDGVPVDSTHSWDFGSGNFNAYGGTVTNTYPTGGASMQKVRINSFNFGYTLNGFCTDRDSSDLESGPIANALFNSDSTAPKTYTFNALPLFDADDYFWDFGDGTTDNTSGASVTHSYAISDTFTVTLTVVSCETDSTLTETFFVTPDFAANVNVGLFEAVNIYPNPTQDVISIDLELNSLENVAITVTDLRGREVLNQELGLLQSSQTKLDMSSLNKGVYLVAVTAGSETTYKKVVLE